MRLMVTLFFMLLACGDKEQDTSVEVEKTEEQQDSAAEEEDTASEEE